MELGASRGALNFAAASGRINAAKPLIESSFNVNVITKDCIVGETPLFAACELRRMTPQRMMVAKLLLKQGADASARSQDGKTVAGLLVQNDSDGLFGEDTDLQQLLAGICNR